MTYKLSIKNIAKSYKRPIIKDVSLEVQTGQIVVLLGPNGAGKTTTFYTIVGLIQPDSGEIFLNEHNLTNLSIDKRAKLGLGYLPQEESIFRQLTVKQNIQCILELRADLNKSEQEIELNKLLNQFHIEHIADSLGQSLSGGEKRRVEIARALASNPKFILLDEPFAGVDPISVDEIKNNISILKNMGIGVLITDHNVKATLEICDYAYVISDGEVAAYGTAKEIKENKKVQEVYIPENYL